MPENKIEIKSFWYLNQMIQRILIISGSSNIWLKKKKLNSMRIDLTLRNLLKEG